MATSENPYLVEIQLPSILDPLKKHYELKYNSRRSRSDNRSTWEELLRNKAYYSHDGTLAFLYKHADKSYTPYYRCHYLHNGIVRTYISFFKPTSSPMWCPQEPVDPSGRGLIVVPSQSQNVLREIIDVAFAVKKKVEATFKGVKDDHECFDELKKDTVHYSIWPHNAKKDESTGLYTCYFFHNRCLMSGTTEIRPLQGSMTRPMSSRYGYVDGELRTCEIHAKHFCTLWRC